MEILNIKIEIKLNEYLFESGEITKIEYESARTVLFNRLTHAVVNDKIEYDYEQNEGMMNREIT